MPIIKLIVLTNFVRKAFQPKILGQNNHQELFITMVIPKFKDPLVDTP